jgi:hypothetical protein
MIMRPFMMTSAPINAYVRASISLTEIGKRRRKRAGSNAPLPS